MTRRIWKSMKNASPTNKKDDFHLEWTLNENWNWNNDEWWVGVPIWHLKMSYALIPLTR